MSSLDLKTLSEKVSYLPSANQHAMVEQEQDKSSKYFLIKREREDSHLSTTILKLHCKNVAGSPILRGGSVSSLATVLLFASDSQYLVFHGSLFSVTLTSEISFFSTTQPWLLIRK